MPRIGKITCALLISILGFGCAMEVGDSPSMADAASVHQALTQDGFTCDVMDAALQLSDAQHEELASLVQASFTAEEYTAAVAQGDFDCHRDRGGDGVGVTVQALADHHDDYDGESIEDATIGGGSTTTTGWEFDIGFWNPSTSQYEYLCGYDGYPLDVLYEVDELAYSHYYQQYLRFTGNDAYGNCIETAFSALSSRVYTDDSIRLCIGGDADFACKLFFTRHDDSLIVGFD